tara:strand:- start:27294 stop:27554 length:261 start_codon:yes stop_codon:yes gene_type:complete
MKRKYVKDVQLESLELKINEERGFLMKNKEQIEKVLLTEREILNDKDHAMTEIEWANNAGWIEALEWVLGRTKVGEDFIFIPEEEV